MSGAQHSIVQPAKQPKVDVPFFQFSVLTSAHHQLATKIIFADDKEVPFSNVKYFHYKYCEFDLLEDFAKVALEWLADQPDRFIIRGQLKPGLRGKQRRLLRDKDGDPATIECPPRRWIVLDIDGAKVAAGLGLPDKVAEAGYHIRDNILPAQFRGIRCVASATSSTGRKGRCTARLRLFFTLTEAADNEALRAWITGLSEKYTWIDPAVMLAHQPIYTARPIFDGCDDPVPRWGRVRVLDGYEDSLAPELPRGFRARNHSAPVFAPPAIHVCDDMPDWMVDLAKADAGLGVAPVEEISDRAWGAIKEVFRILDGSPKGGVGRHAALNTGAWWLARLWAEGELPEAKAREAYLSAAEGINNSDGKYDAALIQRHLEDAFADVGRRGQ
jgi:hypothetical protein